MKLSGRSPTRGAWIETASYLNDQVRKSSLPHAGSVD